MKKFILSNLGFPNAILLCIFLLLFDSVFCQARTPLQNSTNPVDTAGYLCVQRGPNSRLWQQTILTTNQSGDVSTNYSSYMELCTGACYLQNGKYVDSAAQISIVGTGAEATQGPCKVTWAADASTAGGAVQLTSPAGQQFSTRVYGLALMDGSTGSNVLIAPITNSTGVLTGTDQIVYPSAFSGLQADIHDTYLLSGFEQNIVLREQLPSPADYGLNPATTWLEVLTQFFNPPAPVIGRLETNGLSDDLQLDFGDVGIGQGTVFLTPEPSAPVRVHVTKQWQQMEDGSIYLIEQVPYTALTNLLQTLPPHATVTKPDAKVHRTASLKSLLREHLAVSAKSGAIKLAQASSRRPGLVVDYSLLTGSLTNYTFQGDTTYYISGTVDLYGSPIFEGGTVVKYTNATSACLKLLDYHSNFVFNTYIYRPAVFTSANDNTVGNVVSGSSGTPPTNGLATYLSAMNTENSNVLIEHARFSYAALGFWSQNDISHIFRHCQFVQCATNVGLWSDSRVSFQNILAAHCPNMLEGNAIAVDGENMTVDVCGVFAVTDVPYWGSYYGGLTNCIFTGVDNSLTNFTLKNSATASSGTGIYQSVGAASYYLANGSANRDAGTTAINATLLADLQTMTTYPPVVLPSVWCTNNATLFPQAQRDTDTPDLGYHYDPIDFAVYIAISNAAITVLPGTALAGFGTEYGVYLYTNAVFECQGTATSPDYFVHYNAVQEQSTTNWETSDWQELLVGPEYPDASLASLFFTDWSVLAGERLYASAYYKDAPLWLEDCQLYNGTILYNGTQFFSTNCLYRRAYLDLYNSYLRLVVPSTNTLCNNLFWRGAIASQLHTSASLWTFRDNLFDQSTNTVTALDTDIISNNAYVTTNFGVMSYGSNNITLTNSPAYQTGALGLYYYPTNLTTLIHAGSQSAPAAALYHYTVLTNANSIEGTNIVSIGFHYVGVGANGLPIDTNGDGTPDYLEDAIGNGLVNSGEMDWQTPGDMGLTVVITQPPNNSTIP